MVEDLLEERVTHLVIPDTCWRQITAHVQSGLPEETCGVAGGMFEGKAARIQLVLPVTNQLHSPVRFRMEPEGQLAAFQIIEEHCMDLVAIFHSHPTGPQFPSKSDIEEFYYPGILSIILAPAEEGREWFFGAFLISNGKYEQIPVIGPVENE